MVGVKGMGITGWSGSEVGPCACAVGWTQADSRGN